MRSLSQAKRSGTQPAGMEALVDREGQAYERRKRVVLVVEDDRPIGELLASIINDEDGYVAIHVTRPRDALQVLTKVRPDLLVLDVGLPEMSGIELYDK